MKPMNPQRKSPNPKTRRNRQIVGILLLAAILLFFGLVVFRFFYITVSGQIDGVNLADRTRRKYTQETVLKAKRGTIYASNGDVIAEDSNVYTIFAVVDRKYVSIDDKPLYVQDKAKTAQVLSQYLSLSAAQIKKILSPKSKKAFQVEFGNAGKNIDLATKNQIDKQKLTGIYFRAQPARLYPNGTFASHIIGIAQLKDAKDTAKDSNAQLTGVMGIEKYFNRQLTGVNGRQQIQTDANGYELPMSKIVTKKAKDGDNMTLTIDARLQNNLETLMQNVQDKYKPVGLNAVLMNAKTGSILAASQRPTFDAATMQGLGNVWRDTLVEDAYEPGSVMKVISMAATVDSGHYNPNATYQSGAVTLDGSTVRDWNYSGWGTIPFSQVMPRSSNVGMVRLEELMGAATWKKYLERFHMGQKTGITLPGEVSGMYQFSRAIDQANTAFGQGINVTAMQMMQAFSAIANGGKMVQPQIVSKIKNPLTGKTTTYQPKVVGRPISAATAANVLDQMRQVVNNKQIGTGTAYQLPGVDLAVKTGTAQIANPKGGGYLTGDSNYIFSVVGMAPASDPQYILYITMQQPQKMTAPAETILSSIFKPLMTRVLSYGQTSSGATTKQVTMPNVTNHSTAEAKEALANAGLTPVLVGSGTEVVQQLPKANSRVLAGQRAVLLTDGAALMPSVTGWSKNDILKLAQITGIQVNFTGTGYAVAQSIPANSVITTNSRVSVTLQPR
jgi:penicillin-binding protein 2B